MLIEIGANKINAKATHFLSKSKTPIITSRIPTTGNIYPVAPSEFRKSPAEPVGGSIGIKCKNLLAPKTINSKPNTILIILVNCEFIKTSIYWLVIP